MSAPDSTSNLLSLAKRAAGRLLVPPDVRDETAKELISNQLEVRPDLRQWYEEMTDEEARMHFGADEVVESAYLRAGLRLFHAWKVQTLRERLGPGLVEARVLDVGDTDGLVLKHLGLAGTGFNLSAAAVENIRAQGIEAVQGDGHKMPFDDGSFDAVLCFETLEHVDAPIAVLEELARVCKPSGRIFVSIPWVPSTRVKPRDTSIDKGYGHIVEYCGPDFRSLVSHSSLTITWSTVFELLGPPRTLRQRALLATAVEPHLIGGSFRRFQFFEFAPGRSAAQDAATAVAGAVS